jgi:zinc transporter, ZIP family
MVELFMTSSVSKFTAANLSAEASYRNATFSFFGGFLVIFILDKIVHFIVDRLEARKKAAIANSQSRAVLLNNEDETDTARGNASPSSAITSADIEAGAARVAATASSPAAICNSRCPVSTVAVTNTDTTNPANPEGSNNDDNADDDDEEENKNTPVVEGASNSREAPAALIELLESDPHNFALKKMGVLTAIAIFIHNFPEGLVTFSATLADAGVGVAVCVAIALHNAPEGAVIALPIYYATGSKWKAFMWACLSGVSEPIGALVGWAALSNGGDLSFGIVFGLVAGMMTYISVKELIPMSLRYDPKDTVATTCIVAGMALMALSLLLFTL